MSLLMSGALTGSPVAVPNKLSLRAPAHVDTMGRTLVIAPHPDDESLGCGGTIALLREHQQEVFVVFISDGTLSHPTSRAYPAPKLRDLREAEALEALDTLGVPSGNVTFMRLPDRGLPGHGEPGFEDAVAALRPHVAHITPATVLAPWRRDPHPDHRAAWDMTRGALTGRQDVRLLEYPIWLWLLAAPGDAPDLVHDGILVWRLDIATVVARKKAAIAAHRSQTTTLIDDDPAGFRLEPDMLAHFAHPWEIFVETRRR